VDRHGMRGRREISEGDTRAFDTKMTTATGLVAGGRAISE
jgi:hypothetical protein